MKFVFKTSVLCFAVLILFGFKFGGDWKVKKSRHFLIYYKRAPYGYIGNVARESERYYKEITEYLGLRRFNFWTFDNRCKIYIFESLEDYLKNTGCEKWSRGHVDIKEKEITTFAVQEEFFTNILPHEMGHIIFREVIGFKAKIPLWLDEGVAVLQEENRDNYLNAAKALVKNDLYISVKSLSDIRDYKYVIPVIFYSEAASLIEFLLDVYGRDEFIKFCRKIRDGMEWKEALFKVYGFKDLEAFQGAWINNMKKQV